jgi:carbonic anhydrase/acetyltransferase-like protein (isoleucine patch superfamily)
MHGAIEDKVPNISDSAYIAKNATVIGDVTLGDQSSVWFGAVVRGDCLPIRIGDRSNIQDLSVLHVDYTNALTIGNDVTVGHRALLHGCTIEDNVLVGMGAVIMNGAHVGEGSIIGAGALITEGMKVQPRSLVIGMPAKVKREITDEQHRMIVESAKHYAEGIAIYRKSDW